MVAQDSTAWVENAIPPKAASRRLRTMATPPVSAVRTGPRETGARAGPSDSSDMNPTWVPTTRSKQVTPAITQNGTAVASELGLTLTVTSCLRIPVSCRCGGGGGHESSRSVYCVETLLIALRWAAARDRIVRARTPTRRG